MRPIEPMDVLDYVDELMQECFVQQGGLLEDLSINLYDVALPAIPCEAVVLGIYGRPQYFDTVRAIRGITPDLLSFQFEDLLL